MPPSLQQRIYLGFAVALALLIVIGAVAYRTTATLTETAIAVKETHESLTRLEVALSRITDAESALRTIQNRPS